MPHQTARHDFIPTETVTTKNGKPHCIPSKLFTFPSQQRTMHCHIEKDKTEPFPIPIENSVLSYWKRQDWTVPHAKWELWIVNRKRQDWIVPHSKRELCLYRKRQDWIFSHPNRELCIVRSKKTILNRSPCQQSIVTSKKTEVNCSPYQQRALHC